MLVVIVAMFGMAIDLSMLYNRKAELQTVTDAAALAAARQLNGTSAGITNAGAQAKSAAEMLSYNYKKTNKVVWSNGALKFGTSPDANGAWMDASTAAGIANQIFFVKADSGALDSQPGLVRSFFMEIVSPAAAASNMSATSIAGRSTLNVTPLAVCALEPLTPGRARPPIGANQELVEYGFRRGIAYDLMNLSPVASSGPQNFVVDPLDKPGVLGSSSNTQTSVVAPFVCTGSIRATQIVGQSITVSSSFPIDPLYQHLNTRFDQYTGTSCDASSAPPDLNVKPYVYTSIPWMQQPGSQPLGQSANSSSASGKLQTVADDAPSPGGPNAKNQYGPLWSYSKAVKYSAYSAGVPEPANGYLTFAATDWSTLYSPGQPQQNSYPANTPFAASGVNYFLAPSAAHKPGIKDRRVLNIPLLFCPVATGTTTAPVLAIGKFFMTVPATSSSLVGEFAGVAQEANLVSKVELFK
jgi:Flp pilus assembly protein TadG